MTHLSRLLAEAPLALLLIAALALTACGPEQPDPDPIDLFNNRDMGEHEFDGEPELTVPESVDFGSGAVGDRLEATFSLQNDGRTRLHVDSIAAEGPFAVVAPEIGGEPLMLRPDESVEVVLEVWLQDPGPIEGQVVILSDDPEQPEAAVHLAALGHGPCASVEPYWLWFGEVPRGGSRVQVVVLENCSAYADLEVQLSPPVDGEFQARIADASGTTATLSPGGRALVLVEFSTDTIGTFDDVLIIETDDPDRAIVEVSLAAESVPAGCPVAVITGSVLGGDTQSNLDSSIFNAQPLDEVILDASGSYDAEGRSIVEVQWTLLSTPADSGALLTDDADSEQNGLFLDLAGIYEVALDVTAEDDVEACESAVLTIYAVSGSDIHVQLVWDTPGDPERHNDHGTDMDLHFLHPLGEWGEVPYDCFWQNRSPIWGDPESDAGNPRMDIDSTQGWGPENVDMNDPEPGATYRVGVNYFTDRGYGPSRATIRVFLYGELHTELQSPMMVVGQFWEALTITWPEEDINVVDELSSSL